MTEDEMTTYKHRLARAQAELQAIADELVDVEHDRCKLTVCY